MAIDRDRRGAIDIYHGDPQSDLLQTIRDTMNHEGFRRMVGFSSLTDVRASLNVGAPDLVVLDSGLEGGDVCSISTNCAITSLGETHSFQ